MLAIHQRLLALFRNYKNRLWIEIIQQGHLYKRRERPSWDVPLFSSLTRAGLLFWIKKEESFPCSFFSSSSFDAAINYKRLLLFFPRYIQTAAGGANKLDIPLCYRPSNIHRRERRRKEKQWFLFCKEERIKRVESTRTKGKGLLSARSDGGSRESPRVVHLTDGFRLEKKKKKILENRLTHFHLTQPARLGRRRAYAANARSRPYNNSHRNGFSSRLLSLWLWKDNPSSATAVAAAAAEPGQQTPATPIDLRWRLQKKGGGKNVFTTIQSKTGQEKREREMETTKKIMFLFLFESYSSEGEKKPCSFQSGKPFLLCAYTGVVTADTKAVAARVKRLVLTTR